MSAARLAGKREADPGRPPVLARTRSDRCPRTGRGSSRRPPAGCEDLLGRAAGLPALVDRPDVLLDQFVELLRVPLPAMELPLRPEQGHLVDEGEDLSGSGCSVTTRVPKNGAAGMGTSWPHVAPDPRGALPVPVASRAGAPVASPPARALRLVTGSSRGSREMISSISRRPSKASPA